MVGPAPQSRHILMGDEKCGPMVYLVALPPGVNPEETQGIAHGHASNTLRMSVLGVQPMGPARYGPGEFRFQQGYVPYGPDGIAAGPDGGWTLLMFADRRGARMRPVKESGRYPEIEFEAVLADWMGYKSDYFGDEGVELPGESRLFTSKGEIDRGRGFEGSFSETSDWHLTKSAPGLRVAHRRCQSGAGHRSCGQPGRVCLGRGHVRHRSAAGYASGVVLRRHHHPRARRRADRHAEQAGESRRSPV